LCTSGRGDWFLLCLLSKRYKVLDRREKFLKIEMGGQPEVVGVDRRKPHLSMIPVTAASPPQRGVPRKWVQ
jgi:hypothetical protein